MPGLWIAITVGILFPTCGALVFIWWRKQYGISSFRSRKPQNDPRDNAEVIVLNSSPDPNRPSDTPRG